MPPTLEEVSAQARQLPDADKAALAERLLAELGTTDTKIEQIWDAEVQARIQSDNSTPVPSIPHEVLMAQLRRP